MISTTRLHLRRHGRFYASALLGIVGWIVLARRHVDLAAPLAGIAFFGSYLASMVSKVLRVTPASIREQAAWPDEGIAVIVALTLLAIVLSFGSLFPLLRESGDPNLSHLLVVFLTVPLGWTTLHTIMAFHYAHLFYAKHPSAARGDAGGLQFPNTEEPGSWDFLYYSFVIAMTAQVSDVQVTSTRMRRVTLMHGIASLFFNTVILALAVNVAVGL